MVESAYETLQWPIAEADENGDIVRSSLVFQQLTGHTTNVWRLMDIPKPQSPDASPFQWHKSLLIVDTHGNHVNVWAKLEQIKGEEEGAEKKGWRLQLEVRSKWRPSTGDAAAAAELATVKNDEFMQGNQTGNRNYPSPKVGLKDQYDETMRRNPAALFVDFQTYVGHLPFRQSSNGEWLKLCEYPFYARSEDLATMARRLESEMTGEYGSTRPIVKYAVSPSGTGKTASIAAAFVESTKSKRQTHFSHYLYLAFANNKENNFFSDGDVSDKPRFAEMQGGQFMLRCLEKLLAAEQGSKCVQFSETPPAMNDTKTKIENLLGGSLVGGRILVHLDEHRKMNGNADFRRGAMGLLARVGRVVVVATYTEPPMEINPSESSEVCRFPVPVPVLDIRAVMKAVDQLSFPVDPSGFDGTNQRLWATLLFRLGARVSRQLNFLHLGSNPDFATFKDDFKKEALEATGGGAAVSKALTACINLCRFKTGTKPNLPAGCDAVELLLGLTEEELDNIDAKIGSGLVAIPAKDESILFTTSLRALALHDISAEDREEGGGPKSVCWDGAHRFKTQLTATDSLASSPLECAYVWTIATRSARDGALAFSEDVDVPVFRISCKQIMGGRLFNSHDNGSFDMRVAKGLCENTIYYADEKRGGQASHPFGDIFFRTDRNELVLIDVTGSVGERSFQKKGRRLAEWTMQAQEEEGTSNFSFYGVVLAPLLNGESYVNRDIGNVFMVRGSDACRLLGGLVQFMAWFPSAA